MEAKDRPAVKALAKCAYAQTHINSPKGKGGGGKQDVLDLPLFPPLILTLIPTEIKTTTAT